MNIVGFGMGFFQDRDFFTAEFWAIPRDSGFLDSRDFYPRESGFFLISGFLSPGFS